LAQQIQFNSVKNAAVSNESVIQWKQCLLTGNVSWKRSLWLEL